jgi:hypothetical protein
MNRILGHELFAFVSQAFDEKVSFSNCIMVGKLSLGLTFLLSACLVSTSKSDEANEG